MRAAIRNRVEGLIRNRPSWKIFETLLYALGMGAIFYLVDVLSMRWQGLALH